MLLVLVEDREAVLAPWEARETGRSILGAQVGIKVFEGFGIRFKVK